MSVIVIVVSVLLIQSCVKAPTPAFSFEPTVNPEWGDTIFFTNESLDATSYSWDFGDGGSASTMDPNYIYWEADSYDITLTATNEKSSELLTKTIVINEATVLGLVIFEDDGETPINDCDIWVYDNESDWENVEEPQFSETTNNEGIAFFFNLEAQVYYIIVFKQTDNGMWLFAAYTSTPLTQNELNAYGIDCDFIPNTSKSHLKTIENSEITSSSKQFYPVDREVLIK